MYPSISHIICRVFLAHHSNVSCKADRAMLNDLNDGKSIHAINNYLHKQFRF